MKLQRPGRAAAVVGGLVAVSATTVMALAAGTASAAEQGRCTDNVNVRAEPTATSRIVAVCERGTDVTVGEKRNGFVQLTNLHGWASEQYVSVNGSAPARTAPRATPTPGADRRPAAPTTSPAATPERRGSAPTTSPAAGADRRPAAPTNEPRRPAPTEAPSGGAGAAEPAPTRGASPVGGLIP